MSIHDQLVEKAFRRYELQETSASLAKAIAPEGRESARSSPRAAQASKVRCRRVFVLVGVPS